MGIIRLVEVIKQHRQVGNEESNDNHIPTEDTEEQREIEAEHREPETEPPATFELESRNCWTKFKSTSFTMLTKIFNQEVIMIIDAHTAYRC